ncbi:J domain-containing protein [Nocardioides sp. R-C-SC26]|uniref:J domain-containing protein n=1 Tax=Nocardioides sp. R-C-SC26 TaxID=2870414 RepID=UPI001E390BB8|nr:J domain-containing protein [Nocardioides sp. R-C-SC26]
MSESTPSWYDVLGVEPTASAEEIRSAWRSAIADLDPGDRRFQSLSRAAEVLLDAERRRQHDEALAASAAPASSAAPAPMTTTAAEPATPAPAPEHAPPSSAPTSAPMRATTTRVPSRAVAILAETWVLASAAVLAVALVVSAVLVLRDDAGPVSTLPDSREVAAARAAAEAAIVPVLSYDYRDLDASRAAAQGYLTEGQQERYDLLFDEQIAPNAASTQSVVTTRVIASGVVRTGRDRVDVLLFVNRPTTNRQRTVEYRDQVTARMVEVSGDWLVDCLITQPGGSCGDEEPGAETPQQPEGQPSSTATDPVTPQPSGSPRATPRGDATP